MDQTSYVCVLTSPINEVRFSGVTSVTLPGVQGNLGVSPHYASMVIGLKSGIVHLYKKEDILESYFIEGGVAEVGPTECKILTEKMNLLSNLDPRLLQEEINRYHNDLAGIQIEDERRIVATKIAIAEAMIEAIRVEKKEK